MGTNSFHLLVSQADENGYLHILDSHKESVRLGDALSKDDRLPAEKVQEAVLALKRMKRIASQYNPQFRVIATSMSCRFRRCSTRARIHAFLIKPQFTTGGNRDADIATPARADAIPDDWPNAIATPAREN